MSTCPNCGLHWWACYCSERQREESFEDPYSSANLDPTYTEEDAEKFEKEITENLKEVS